MAKHTTGSWYAQRGASQMVSQDTTVATLARGDDERWHIFSPVDSLGDAEADANLIAAAPGLLAHLQFAVKLLGAFPAVNATAQVEAMRAAIARALPHTTK